jgi:hypothetical protein
MHFYTGCAALDERRTASTAAAGARKSTRGAVVQAASAAAAAAVVAASAASTDSATRRRSSAAGTACAELSAQAGAAIIRAFAARTAGLLRSAASAVSAKAPGGLTSGLALEDTPITTGTTLTIAATRIQAGSRAPTATAARGYEDSVAKRSAPLPNVGRATAFAPITPSAAAAVKAAVAPSPTNEDVQN